jgi:FdhD protein
MNQEFKAQGSKKYKDSQGHWDDVIVESPLAIKINDLNISNIRTPGDDLDLVKGFLLSEAFINQLDDIEKISQKQQQGLSQEDDVDSVTVKLKVSFSKSRHERILEIRPSCGICGENSFSDNAIASLNIEKNSVSLKSLLQSIQGIKKSQALFAKTGACHAAALLNHEGEILVLAEDVGRHNAVDKVIGKAAEQKIDFKKCVLFLSGRCGIELISKAIRMSIPVIASVSGSTSMSLELAKKTNLTLISFCRGDKARVYHDPSRLKD